MIDVDVSVEGTRSESLAHAIHAIESQRRRSSLVGIGIIAVERLLHNLATRHEHVGVRVERVERGAKQLLGLHRQRRGERAEARHGWVEAVLHVWREPITGIHVLHWLKDGG